MPADEQTPANTPAYWARVERHMQSVTRVPHGLANVRERLTITIDREGKVRVPRPSGLLPQWDPTKGEQVLLHEIRIEEATCLAGPDGAEYGDVVVVAAGGGKGKGEAGVRGEAEVSGDEEDTPPDTDTTYGGRLTNHTPHPDMLAPGDKPYVTVQLQGEWCEKMAARIVMEQIQREEQEAKKRHWRRIYRSIGWQQGVMGVVRFPHPGTGAAREAQDAGERLPMGDNHILVRRPGPANAILSEFLASRTDWMSTGRVRVVGKLQQYVPVLNPVMWFILANDACPKANMRPHPTGESIYIHTSIVEEVQQVIRESLEHSILYLSRDGMRFKTTWSPHAPPDAILILTLTISYVLVGGSGAHLDVIENVPESMLAPAPVPEPVRMDATPPTPSAADM